MDNSTAPLPATGAALFRYAIGILGPLAVSKGWVGESDLANISTLVTSAGFILYGLWKTHDRQTRLTNAESGRIS